MPENLNLKFRSKFNPVFTCHGCLNYAILRAIYGFKVRRDHKAKHSRLHIHTYLSSNHVIYGPELNL